MQLPILLGPSSGAVLCTQRTSVSVLMQAAAAETPHFPPQAIESVPKISEDYNPATWMLEVANHGVESRTGQDFAELYNNSDMRTCAPALHMSCTSFCGRRSVEIVC